MTLIGSRPLNPFAAPPVVGTPPIASPPGGVNMGPFGNGSPAGIASPEANAAADGGGIWGRIKSELQKPGVAAALFRSGAATMQGGLGAGLQAGAGYMDDRHAMEAQQQQQAIVNNQHERALANDYAALQEKMKAAQRPHYMVVPEGGALIGQNPDGSFVDPDAAARYLGGGQPPQAAPQPQASPRVATAQDYARLPPGAEYVTPDGSRRRKGGAPSQGGATFP